MAKLMVVCKSKYGNTERIAESVTEGLKKTGGNAGLPFSGVDKNNGHF